MSPIVVIGVAFLMGLRSYARVGPKCAMAWLLGILVLAHGFAITRYRRKIRRGTAAAAT